MYTNTTPIQIGYFFVSLSLVTVKKIDRYIYIYTT